MISHKYRAIFIHIPKTAGTSIEQKFGHFDVLSRGVQDHRTVRAIRPLSLFTRMRFLLSPPLAVKGLNRLKMLREMLGLSERGNRESKGKYLRRIVLSDLLFKNPGLHGRRATKQEFTSYFKFTVVRNPWARIYSWYRAVTRDPMFEVPPCDFATYLHKYADNWALHPQTHWLTDFDGSLPFERVVRFENLADDMHGVLADLGFRDRTLPHLLKGDCGADYRAAYSDQLAELVAERYRDEIKLFGYSF